MAFAQSHALLSGTAGTGPSGPIYIRPKPRRLLIDQVNGLDFIEVDSSTSLSKADLVSQAHAVDDTLPVSALGWERFFIGSGGAGYSGTGFGGLPGATARDIIAFDDIPDGTVFEIEIGAPGVGQAGGQGTAGGASAIYPFNVAHMYVEGGLPGEATQTNQRELHLWAMQNGIQISDLGQNSWHSVYPVGPSSPTGPGAGAPNNFDEASWWQVEGGYGSRSLDVMYQCGDGGSANPAGGDYIGQDAFGVGGGGGAGDAAYPGGSGHVGAFRYAIIVMEVVNG